MRAFADFYDDDVIKLATGDDGSDVTEGDAVEWEKVPTGDVISAEQAATSVMSQEQFMSGDRRSSTTSDRLASAAASAVTSAPSLASGLLTSAASLGTSLWRGGTWWRTG